MKNFLALLLILVTLTIFPQKTDEEHYKDAAKYSEDSKWNFIMAGIAFAFVIVVKIIHNRSGKENK